MIIIIMIRKNSVFTYMRFFYMLYKLCQCFEYKVAVSKLATINHEKGHYSDDYSVNE